MDGGSSSQYSVNIYVLLSGDYPRCQLHILA